MKGVTSIQRAVAKQRRNVGTQGGEWELFPSAAGALVTS